MSLTLAELYASPDHYLHSFDGDAAVFVPMDAAAYRASIFLDDRIAPARPGTLRLPLGILTDPPPVQPAQWIFHVAHCGSTLLARALGELGGNLVLREPLALRQLGLESDPARLRLALGLLTRRYEDAGPTLIKANVPVNFILDDLAASGAVARGIVLHCGLEDYLAAILRSDNHRGWLRTVTGHLAGYLGDLAGRPDGELGAALWIAQQRRFAALIAAQPGVRSLDAEHFFAAPGPALTGAARHLGIAAGPEAVAALIAGPLFATYSKNPAQAFDNAARLARRSALGAGVERDIAQGLAWLERHAPDAAAIAAVVAAASLEP